MSISLLFRPGLILSKCISFNHTVTSRAVMFSENTVSWRTAAFCPNVVHRFISGREEESVEERKKINALLDPPLKATYSFLPITSVSTACRVLFRGISLLIVITACVLQFKKSAVLSFFCSQKYP